MSASSNQSKQADRLPTLYIPHGGGPCFFMEWTMGPPDTWDRMRASLQEMGRRFEDVSTLLVVSAHWETSGVTVQTGVRPPLLYDYYGFPQHTYELTWPASGAPEVAGRALDLLLAAGIDAHEDRKRGFDHGTFVPLKVAFPEAHIPTFQVSLKRGLDAAEPPKQNLPCSNCCRQPTRCRCSSTNTSPSICPDTGATPCMLHAAALYR